MMLCVAVHLLTFAAAAGAQKQAVSSAAWLVEWDLDKGWSEAQSLGADLESLLIFAVSFDGDDQLRVDPRLEAWLSRHASSFSSSGRRTLLTIVNDVYPEGGQNVAKDTELITRLMATPSSRERHKNELLAILDRYGLDGLDMDYEKVSEQDWPVYLEFCRDLHAELSARGKTLRVVVEPKPVYYRKPYPEGPEYVVMAYNLFGFHTKKGGPKCDMRFIGKLASQRKTTGVPFRLALSLGGFLWKKDGKTTSLTEEQALELVEKHKARQRRDPGSGYQFFSFTDESGAQCEVWYADAQTLLTLMRTAKGFGFTGIDLWRLGGINEKTLDSLKSSFSRQGRVHAVGSGVSSEGSVAHATIKAAVSAAQPGDTIIISPGEYHESVVIDKPNLTILGDVFADSLPGVTISGLRDEPTVTDSANTLWRGIAFSGGLRDDMVSLDSFAGRFEHCVFDLGKGSSERVAVQIYSGSPSFQACRFIGDGGLALGISARTLDHSLYDFTYCLFDGFDDGMISVDENVDLRFVNCIFTNNGIFFARESRFNGNIDIHNSVLYFNKTVQLATERPGARPVRITDSLYTPQFNEYLWITGELLENQPGLNVERTRARSPRFTRSGKPLILNLGIDDIVNAEVWEEVSKKTDTYGMKVSLAVNTSSVTAEDVETLRRTVSRGHEIGSHTADHLAVQPDPPLSVGYMPSGVGDAGLTILPGELLTIRAGDKEICSIPLDVAGMNVNALSNQLEKAGIRTSVSFYHGGTPVHLLSPVKDLDIFFPDAVVPLYTDNLSFIKYELTKSLADLKEFFPGRERFVFMCPFGVNSKAAKEIMAESGYYGGRSAVDASTIGWVEVGAEEAELDIYNIPSSSFQTARTLIPGNGLMDNVLLTMEYLKRHFSVYSIYSHTWKELSPEEWDEALELLGSDPQIRTATLEEIVEYVTGVGERRRGNTYSYPVERSRCDYRPLKGSALIEGGEDFGLPFDFSGGSVLPGSRPNIGLYQ